MYHDYKVISVTPAGRKKYLEILHLNLLKQRHIIDNHIWWINTSNTEDIEYLNNLQRSFPDFYKIQNLPNDVTSDKSKTIFHFFEPCQDENTIYIRFDDDVCFIADNAVEELLKYRVANKDPFLIFPIIINNCLILDVLQSSKILSDKNGRAGYNCLGEGWKNFLIAERAHTDFLDLLQNNEINKVQFPSFALQTYERVSINCICWFGKDFKDFNGKVDPDEEIWLSTIKPKSLNRPNHICGKSVISHFAFWIQREYLEKNTDLLTRYLNLVK